MFRLGQRRGVSGVILVAVAVVTLAIIGTLATFWPRPVTLPPMFVSSADSNVSVDVDVEAVHRFSRHHKLPRLPDLTNLNPYAAQDFHTALQAIANRPQESESIGHLGRVLHSHEYMDEAIDCYLMAMKLAPDRHEWAYYLGRIYADRHQNESAIEQYELAARLTPDYASTFLSLGHLYVRSNRREEARRSYERFIELRPKSPHGHLGLAQLAFDNQQFEDVVDRLEHAIQFQSDDFRIHSLLGRAYQQLGQSERANRHLAFVARLNAQSEVMKQVFFDDPLYHEVLKSNSTDMALAERLRSARATKQFSVALDLANELCRRHPTDAERMHRLAAVQKDAKKYSEALASVDRAIALNANMTEASATRAQLLIILRRHEEALRELNDLVKHAPDSFRGHYYRGTVLVLMNRYEAAAASFSEAVRIEPNSARAHVALAEALRLTGSHDESFIHFQRALKIDPLNRRARRAVATGNAARATP